MELVKDKDGNEIFCINAENRQTLIDIDMNSKLRQEAICLRKKGSKYPYIVLVQEHSMFHVTYDVPVGHFVLRRGANYFKDIDTSFCVRLIGAEKCAFAVDYFIYQNDILYKWAVQQSETYVKGYMHGVMTYLKYKGRVITYFMHNAPLRYFFENRFYKYAHTECVLSSILISNEKYSWYSVDICSI
jgi:hypothetical protein